MSATDVKINTQMGYSPSTLAGKWLGLVTAVWVQCVSGNNYTFSNYSVALKSAMALTQLQLNNLSVAKDVGKAFGILAGLSSDRIPTSLILLIGSVEGFIGYGAQWLVVSRRVAPLPYWSMLGFLCMGGNSTTWMNTAVLVTCMRNFRNNRGPVSGVLKGYVGLSTAIFTDVCSALFQNDPSAMLLILMFVPIPVCLFAAVFLREAPSSANSKKEEKQESNYFVAVNVMAVIIAVYLLAFDISGKHGRLFSKIFAGILFILLASPLVIPAHLVLKRFVSSSVETLPVAGAVQLAVVAEDAAAEEGRRDVAAPVIGEDHTIWEAVKTVDFWILFLSFLCGVGTGLSVMNNLGQMGEALGYRDVSTFISLTSICGFFGRILSGSVSEYFMRKNGTPRPIWNAASQVLMAIGYTIMAIALPGSLYIGSIVVGMCYGVRLAVTVPIASELFGLKYYGLMYNILILNLPIGSLLFSGLLAGFLYDSQATRTPGGGNTCIGPHCYRIVFVVMAVASVVGFGLDVVLALRTKALYSGIYVSRKSVSTSESGGRDE